jgi:hypothetical protein
MGQATIRRLGDKIRSSAYIIPFYHILVLGILVCLIRSVFDFYTSYLAIVAAPINQFDNGLITFANNVTIALTPQLVNVITAYVLLALAPTNKTESYLWWVVAVVFFVSMTVSIYTGYLYYADTLPGAMVGTVPLTTRILSLVIAGVIDTIGSEIGLAFTIGLALELRVDYLKQMGLIRADRSDNRYAQEQRRHQHNQPQQQQPQRPARHPDQDALQLFGGDRR